MTNETENKIQRTSSNPLVMAAQFVQTNRDKLATYLPAAVDQEKFLTSVFLAFDNSKDLRDAITTPQGQTSVMSALRLAACKGLSLNPQEGLAGFLPYRGTITYRVFAAGLIELAIRDGHLKEMRTRVIYENDRLSLGENQDGDTYSLERSVDDPGELRGFLAVGRLPDNTIRTLYMTAAQVAEWGERYGMRNRDGKLSPMWRDSFEGAGQKTVARQLLTKLHVAIPGIEEPEEEERIASYVVEAEFVEPTPSRRVKKGTSPADLAAMLDERKDGPQSAGEENTDEPSPDAENAEQGQAGNTSDAKGAKPGDTF